MHRVLTAVIITSLALAPSLVQAAGEPDPGFGTDGVVTVGLLDEVGPIAVDPAGRTVVVGTHAGNIAFARYLPDGTPDTSFSGDGRADVALPVARFRFIDIRILADGSIISGGERTTDPDNPFTNALWAARVTGTGQPDTTYGGGDGVAIFEQGYNAFGASGSFATDGSTVIAQTALGGNVAVAVSSSGVFDEEAGLDNDPSAIGPGCSALNGERPFAAASISATEFVHVGDQVFGCGGDPIEATIVTRQTTSGTVLWSKAILRPQAGPQDAQSRGIEIVGSDVILATSDGSAATLHRISLDDGSTIPTWGTNGRVQVNAEFGEVGGITALAGGKIAIVNAPLFAEFEDSPTNLRIVQLMPDGAIDPSFPPVTVAVGGELTSTDIADTPDGHITAAAQTVTTGTLRRFIGSTTGTPAAVPIAPVRLFESRPGETTIDGQFQGNGQLAAGSITKVRIAGRPGIPTDAAAAIVNLTVVSPSGNGYATLYPCTPDVPNSSSINYGPGDFIANGVTVKLDTNGDVCIYTLAATDILIDANGYIGG